MINAQFQIFRFPEKHLTKGVLLLHDEIMCDTLEDIVRDRNADGDLDDQDEGKVYGETAIPYGIYELIVNESPKFGREMTLILNVEGFTGIRIHWGRTIKQSFGCVLVGKENGETLDNTGMTDKITAIVKEMQKKEKVYLHIR